MKNLFLFSVTALACLAAGAQTYNSPESVVFDAANNRYLISNNGNNRILARSASGVLTNFTTNITSGPHGLEIVGNTVYACDGSSVKGFDLTTAALVFNVNLGASFANGICTDGSNLLFVTDFTAKKVFKVFIATQTFSTFVSGLGPSPNGIFYDGANGRIVWVNWGTNAPISQALLSDSSVSTVTTTTLGNCDGLVQDGAGNYYVSAWSSSGIWRFNSSFGSPVQVVTGLNSPADIHYNLANDTLASPNSGNNTVTFHYFGPQTTVNPLTGKLNYLVLYPNPCNNQLNVISGPETKQSHIIIFNAVGEQVFKWELTGGNNKIDVAKMPEGVYFVQLISEKGTETRKLCITR